MPIKIQKIITNKLILLRENKSPQLKEFTKTTYKNNQIRKNK